MTVYTASIAAGEDDAYEFDSGSGFAGTGTTLRMDDTTVASARGNTGLRFPGTGVPQGSTINVGTFLTCTASASTRDSPDATIYCESADASVNFVTDADVTSRAPTAAGVLYVAFNIGTGAVNTPDLAAPVQEVVNRAGYGAGTVITFIGKGNNNSAGEGWRILAYENGSGFASVTIDYTEPVGGATLVQRTLVGIGV